MIYQVIYELQILCNLSYFKLESFIYRPSLKIVLNTPKNFFGSKQYYLLEKEKSTHQPLREITTPLYYDIILCVQCDRPSICANVYSAHNYVITST